MEQVIVELLFVQNVPNGEMMFHLHYAFCARNALLLLFLEYIPRKMNSMLILITEATWKYSRISYIENKKKEKDLRVK